MNKPDVPSLADEIAEQHPDMNIKVATFTVSEKSSNTGGLNDSDNVTTLYKATIRKLYET